MCHFTEHPTPLPCILVIAGTNRSGSRTLRLARHVADGYAKLGVRVNLLDLSELGPDWFTPAAYASRNDATRPIVRRVLDADGLVSVIPEYNGSFPGVAKHFLDLLPFPAALAGKASAFIGLGAGQWGGLRAVEQMQAIFAYRNAHILPERIFVPRADEEITDKQIAPAYADRIHNQSTAMLRFVKLLAAGRVPAAT